MHRMQCDALRSRGCTRPGRPRPHCPTAQDEADEAGTRSYLCLSVSMAAELMKARVFSSPNDEVAVVFYGAVSGRCQGRVGVAGGQGGRPRVCVHGTVGVGPCRRYEEPLQLRGGGGLPPLQSRGACGCGGGRLRQCAAAPPRGPRLRRRCPRRQKAPRTTRTPAKMVSTRTCHWSSPALTPSSS
jgi:hypothetical protein